MIKIMLLGASPCEFSREYLKDFLQSLCSCDALKDGAAISKGKIAADFPAAVLDASTQPREFCKIERECFGDELPALCAENIEQIKLLYLRDTNPFLLLSRLHSEGLFDALAERIREGLAVVAAGGAALAMAPTLESAMNMPLAALPHLRGLAGFGAALQVGDLDEHKRAAFDEFFALNPSRSVFIIPARSGLLINGESAQAKGCLIKLTSGFEQFFNADEFIRLPSLPSIAPISNRVRARFRANEKNKKRRRY